MSRYKVWRCGAAGILLAVVLCAGVACAGREPGDSGRDTVSEDNGRDAVSGDNGRDAVSEDSGRDVGPGDNGRGAVSEDSGRDAGQGDSGRDAGPGDSGRDTVSGDSGRDAMSGDSGRDAMSEDSGRDAGQGDSERDVGQVDNGRDARQGGTYTESRELGALPPTSSGRELGRFVPEKKQMQDRLSAMLDGEVPCVLPSAYDFRQVGRAPEIRNQGTLGTCWAFASLTALESALLPDETIKCSVDHMTLNNGFCLTGEDGGEYTMSMAYLLSWQGPVLEADDPYGDGVSPDGLAPVKHVQEIRILPEKDYEKIKRAVYLYGGVQSSLYTSLTSASSRSEEYDEQYNSYCYMGAKRPNHDSVIIGWDDHFPKEYFRAPVEGDGAFICATSWGEEFGDDGYFYVSYYDTNIGRQNLVYTSVESTDHYQHIYQSDLRGWVGQLGYGEDTAYAANVYESRGDESLEAVGFYATGPGTEYEVYVVRHMTEVSDLSQGEAEAAGRLADAGYYTIPLSRPVDLDQGERFAVVVRLTTPGSVQPVAVEFETGDSGTIVDTQDGEGYLSLDGNVWRRVEEAQNCNICLKAYTIDR